MTATLTRINDPEAVYAGLVYSVIYAVIHEKDERIFSRHVIAQSWEQAEEQCGPGESVDGRVEATFPDDGAAEQFKQALQGKETE